jgi:hypothetical protein
MEKLFGISKSQVIKKKQILYPKLLFLFNIKLKKDIVKFNG